MSPVYEHIESYHSLTCGVMKGKRCGGHACGGICDLEAKTLLNELIRACKDDLAEENDLSHSKFDLEELVIHKLSKIAAEFQTHCTERHFCSILHLGCRNGRYCLEVGKRAHMVERHGGDHSACCPLVKRPPKQQCDESHVCNSQSPNMHLVTELLELKNQVVKLLQAPFAPCVLPEISPDDSASLFHTMEIATQVFDAKDISEFSSVSDLSCSSVPSLLSGDGGPHCFLPQMLFRTGGGPIFYMLAQDLRVGSQVLSADGAKMLEVTRIDVHNTSTLIELHVEGAPRFTTTPTHRIMVPYGAQPHTVAAKDLQVGSFVLCSDNMAQKVSHIKTLCEENEVLAIAFKPDEPVTAFLAPPSMVMTKGFKARATRRSGMNRRAVNPRPAQGEQASEFIGTAPGEYSD